MSTPSTLPTTQDDAWTWEEFADVAAELRASLPDDKYPFVYNWQRRRAPRWLSWLFQADGTFLDEDGTTPTIDSPAGEKALDFTKSFFDNNWVPPTSSTKAHDLRGQPVRRRHDRRWRSSARSSCPTWTTSTSSTWTSVPMPRDERGATDLGGNALVATKDTQNPELAAEFLKFMVSADAMTAFCRRDERAADADRPRPGRDQVRRAPRRDAGLRRAGDHDRTRRRQAAHVARHGGDQHGACRTSSRRPSSADSPRPTRWPTSEGHQEERR